MIAAPGGRIIEGVPYLRYRVTFRDRSGKRWRLMHWSPGPPWIGAEVTRLLNEEHDVEPGATVIIQPAPARP